MEETHTGQEAVELHQELQVDIVALGGLAVRPLDVVAVQIDTYKSEAIVSPKVQRMLNVGKQASRNAISCIADGASTRRKPLLETSIGLPTRTQSAGNVLHVPMAAVVCRW